MTIAPIIIAGSGPAGSTLALALAQADIPVLLLEKENMLPIDLRASTFHPPSLDLLDDLGVAEDMMARGLIVDCYQYRDRRTGEVAEFDMSLLRGETRHPFRLQLEQYELTRIISERLRAFPHVEQRFDAPVNDVRLHDDHVEVDINGRKETASFLIGADGASSTVRQCLAIDFDGFTYDERFLVASTPFPFEDVFENLSYVNYISDPDEWCVVLRTDKLWRVLWPIHPDVDGEVCLSDGYLQGALHRLYEKPGDYEIGHRTLYHVHQRVAETYVKGRVALIGDAAHINNPLGGMGMNGGLHDAFNIADKLTAVVRHGADWREAFTLYDRQRRILAVRFVQEHTIRNKKLMESTDRDVQQERQKTFMETAADPEKARDFIRERAMIDCLRESLEVR